MTRHNQVIVFILLTFASYGLFVWSAYIARPDLF